MTPGFQDIIAAAEADRRDLFLSTSMRLGTPIQNVEKDFWVCWVLDLLFNGAGDDEPRLLFKGGTSLSKSHGLISRFSEDIDITVFREDLGQAVDVEDLEGLSGKKQRAHMNAIKEACQRYITSTLKTRLTASIASAFERAGLPVNPSAVTLDPDDPDQQTLLIAYPAVSAQPGDYNPPTVKIEAGAKSALDPHRATRVTPYLAEDVPNLMLNVANVVTIDAERTFWDKVVILHGLVASLGLNGAVSCVAKGSASPVTTTTSTVCCAAMSASVRRAISTWPETAHVTHGCFSTAAIWIWPPPILGRFPCRHCLKWIPNCAETTRPWPG